MKTLKSTPGVTQDHWNWHHSTARILSSYGRSYLVSLARQSEIMVENHDFFSYSMHLTPPLCKSPMEYCRNVWYGNTIMAVHQRWRKLENICTRFDAIHERDRWTGGQTEDGLTPHYGIGHAWRKNLTRVDLSVSIEVNK